MRRGGNGETETMSRARRALSRAYDRPQILFSAAIRSWERPQDLQSRF